MKPNCTCTNPFCPWAGDYEDAVRQTDFQDRDTTFGNYGTLTATYHCPVCGWEVRDMVIKAGKGETGEEEEEK